MKTFLLSIPKAHVATGASSVGTDGLSASENNSADKVGTVSFQNYVGKTTTVKDIGSIIGKSFILFVTLWTLPAVYAKPKRYSRTPYPTWIKKDTTVEDFCKQMNGLCNEKGAIKKYVFWFCPKINGELNTNKIAKDAKESPVINAIKNKTSLCETRALYQDYINKPGLTVKSFCKKNKSLCDSNGAIKDNSIINCFTKNGQPDMDTITEHSKKSLVIAEIVKKPSICSF